MRHRIFVERIEPRTVVTGEEFHHAVRVVRVRESEAVELFDSTGEMASGTIAAIERDHAVVVTGERVPSRESRLGIDLRMAIVQLEKFELVLQKATELGVRTITPLVTERIELRRERYAGKTERWERIVFEAVKQSGRSLVPRIEAPSSFEDAVVRPGLKILFDAEREPVALPAEAHELALFIGPEGGWSDAELTAAERAGCCFQRLGPRRLRAETAAIAALAAVHSRFGDLRLV